MCINSKNWIGIVWYIKENLMKKLTFDKITTNAILIFLFLFLLTGLQIITPLTAPLRFALITLIGSLFFFILYKKKSISRYQLVLFSPFVLFQFIYILNSYSHTNLDTFFSIFYLIVFGMWVFIVTNVEWRKSHVSLFYFLSILLYIILVLYSVSSINPLNPNSIGAYAYFLSFFPLLYFVGFSKKYKPACILFLFLLCGTIIYFSEARAIFLSIAFGLITFLIWKLISKSKVIFYMYFTLIITFGYFLTVIYPRLEFILPNFEYYNSLMIEYTGKTLNSGRDRIWSALIDKIQERLFLGYGSGTLPSDFITSTLSAHNLYIQISLQVGIIGLSFFLLFLFLTWRTFWLERNNPKVILIACYFIGIIVYQLFEVTLTQNNFSLGLLQWTIIGFGLSFTLNRDGL